MLNVFAAHNYRDILKNCLTAKKVKHAKHFTFINLAKACRVQRTYVSAVINGRAHLSSDQLFDACCFLEMSDDETQYAILVMELERSSSQQRRKKLKYDIEQIRSRNMKSTQYVAMTSSAPQTSSDSIEFYLDVNAQLIHMFLTIPRFRTDPLNLRKMFNLDAATFELLLKKIANAGLIRVSQRKIEILKDDFYLPPSSNLYPAFRSNMRLKALELFQTQPLKPHYSFSAFYSADSKTLPTVQARFFEFLNWAKDYTQDTKPSDVYQMNFDLLRWSPDSEG